MEKIELPQELLSYIGSENIDFAVKACRARPLKQSFSLIFFGAIWLAFTSLFVFAFLGPLLLGKEVHFESNGVPTVASLDNLAPASMPAAVIGVFVIVGLAIFSWGIFYLCKKGGYFVGTPTRLIYFRNDDIRSIDWNQFSGDIKSSGNAKKGNISLNLKIATDEAVTKESNQFDLLKYIPNFIYILGIPNVFEVEQICRKRIQENNPTPKT